MFLILISHIPSFLNQKDILAIPTIIQTVFTIFAFLAMFCGKIYGFYDRFWCNCQAEKGQFEQRNRG